MEREDLMSLYMVGTRIVLLSALLNLGVEIYALSNVQIFSTLFSLSGYEAFLFFLTVLVPTLCVMSAAGYYFYASRRDIQDLSSNKVLALAASSLACMVVSSLSWLRLPGFLGGFLVLAASLALLIGPSFRSWTRMTSHYLSQIGAILSGYAAVLFSLLTLLSVYFITYSLGSLSGMRYYFLLLSGGVAFSSALIGQALYSSNTRVGLSGAFFLTVSLILTILGLQNRYTLFNAPAYLGVLTEGIGIVLLALGGIGYLALYGRTTYIHLPAQSAHIVPRLVRFCPRCGEMRKERESAFCPMCGGGFVWHGGLPFCPYCGRVVPSDASVCPHCREALA